MTASDERHRHSRNLPRNRLRPSALVASYLTPLLPKILTAVRILKSEDLQLNSSGAADARL